MKLLPIVGAMLLFVGALFGCKTPPAQEMALYPMEQRYHGIIPCGSHCTASEASLWLASDGHYILQQQLPGDRPIARQGAWLRTADRLTLLENSGRKWVFKPTQAGLEMTHPTRHVLLVPVPSARGETIKKPPEKVAVI